MPDPAGGGPVSVKPPRFTSTTCTACQYVRINDPATQEGERWVRRDERRLLAEMVKASMAVENLRRLTKTEQKLLAQLAQSLLTAIAERENAA